MSVKINWADIVPKAEEAAKGYRKTVGTAINLRGLFYALVSTDDLPNTKNSYKGLSKALSKARKAGSFAWGLLQDTTRPTFNQEKYPISVEDLKRYGDNYAKSALREIDSQINKIQNPNFRYSAFKWEGQPKRVMIAVEKEGAAKAIANLTSKWKVEVNATRGYSSTTNMKEMAERLQDLQAIDGVESLELILVTDFDPSGEDITRFMAETLWVDYGVDVNVTKVLVTKPQIAENNLPNMPEDAEERAKMQRDPRWDGWTHGFFRVELDSMLAIVPDEFSRILNEAIEIHFDYDIEAEVKDKVAEIREAAEAQMEELAERLGDIPALVSELVQEFEDEED